MAKKSRQGDRTGTVHKGRHEFGQEYYEAIRAWLRVQIEQVQHSLNAVNEHISKHRTDVLIGQRDYWATALSYLHGIYRRSMRSVDALAWLEAYTHVRIKEGFTGSDATTGDQPRLPLM